MLSVCICAYTRRTCRLQSDHCRTAEVPCVCTHVRFEFELQTFPDCVLVSLLSCCRSLDSLSHNTSSSLSVFLQFCFSAAGSVPHPTIHCRTTPSGSCQHTASSSWDPPTGRICSKTTQKVTFYIDLKVCSLTISAHPHKDNGPTLCCAYPAITRLCLWSGCLSLEGTPPPQSWLLPAVTAQSCVSPQHKPLAWTHCSFKLNWLSMKLDINLTSNVLCQKNRFPH